MLKVMDLKFYGMEFLMTILFYIFIAVVLILGANKFERLGLNYISNNIVENSTR